MKDHINTQHGQISLPAFMPDATYGAIKSISFDDAKKAGVTEIVTTTLHIERTFGSKEIESRGGIHQFIGWDRPILTDSGGWQVFSLINSRINKTHEKLEHFATEVGCSFFDEKTGKQTVLTPESSIQIQHDLNADILTALDFPILGDSSLAERKKCVEINTKWAARSKLKYDELYSNEKKLIGCVIQGGDDFELRKRSANELIEMNYDLYNFGGMPIWHGETWKSDRSKRFYREMLHYVYELIPKEKFKYAMGIGQPDDIAFCVDIGWDLFDTVLPTRNARHGFIYVSEGSGEITKNYTPQYKLKGEISSSKFAYDVLHIKTQRYQDDELPLDSNCSCECCQKISRKNLRELIRKKDPEGFRYATIHNLAFYSNWMKMLRSYFLK